MKERHRPYASLHLGLASPCTMISALILRRFGYASPYFQVFATTYGELSKQLRCHPCREVIHSLTKIMLGQRRLTLRRLHSTVNPSNARVGLVLIACTPERNTRQIRKSYGQRSMKVVEETLMYFVWERLTQVRLVQSVGVNGDGIRI